MDIAHGLDRRAPSARGDLLGEAPAVMAGRQNRTGRCCDFTTSVQNVTTVSKGGGNAPVTITWFCALIRNEGGIR